jgi:hypothetical protein
MPHHAAAGASVGAGAADGAGGFLTAESHLMGFTEATALYQGARELVENALGEAGVLEAGAWQCRRRYRR